MTTMNSAVRGKSAATRSTTSVDVGRAAADQDGDRRPAARAAPSPGAQVRDERPALVGVRAVRAW